MPKTEIIHLAPLQGFTDFIYRECFHQSWKSIDQYYIPYLSIGPGKKIRNSQKKDADINNNKDIPVIPQLLPANTAELNYLLKIVSSNNYDHINLNLGCPYPMATKKGRGAGLLENTDELKAVLDDLFTQFSFKISVKLRSGLTDSNTCIRQLDLINSFPFEKVILHPRTAKQMYKGKADIAIFSEIKNGCKHPVIYNGDIFSLENFQHLKTQFPDQNEWMLGRGILMNPFLPELIKNDSHNETEKSDRLLAFHNLLYQRYSEKLDTDGHVLNKMQQFWIYFSFNFNQPKKVLKMVKKTNNLKDYPQKVEAIFNQFLIDP